jgi:Poly(A) polymerase catalytic subunit
MEEDTKQINSALLNRAEFQKQISLLKAIADQAQERIDFASAHDPETIQAIRVVEQFLRTKHRLCYGGQAINAHLPKKCRFYDPNYNVPDYDFFSPDQDSDIQTIVKSMRKAGFTEISAREGMHEGTIKIYVNFVPVADITRLDPKLYRLLSEREFKNDGISYLDANTLRMLMYLELSRPKGQVDRWGKVYERLLLLNEFVPVNSLQICLGREVPTGIMSDEEVHAIMRYIILEKRVFAGASLVGFYKNSLRTQRRKASWLMNSTMPIYFYSEDIEKDTTHFRYELRELSPTKKISVQKISAMGGDLIPPARVFLRDGVPILIIVSQTACHSYYNIPVRHGEVLRVATLDTLITLYFSMALIGYKAEQLASLECLAQELVEVSSRAREKPDTFPFPFISLHCSGYQKSIPSLIREKVQRIATEKARIRGLIKTNSARITMKRNKNKNKSEHSKRQSHTTLKSEE